MKYVPALLGIGQLSGSGGSVVASHNRWGSYFRNRVIPVNPNTIGQIARRNNFAEMSTSWRNLSAGQIAAWETLGAQIPVVDNQGITHFLNGFGAYARVNLNRKLFALPLLLEAPIMLATIDLATLTGAATAVIPSLSVAFTPTPIGVGNRLKVKASAQFGNGITYVGESKLRALTYTADNVASPLDLLAAWTSRFGVLISPQRFVVEASIVNSSFLEGASLRTFVTVVP